MRSILSTTLPVNIWRSYFRGRLLGGGKRSGVKTAISSSLKSSLESRIRTLCFGLVFRAVFFAGFLAAFFVFLFALKLFWRSILICQGLYFSRTYSFVSWLSCNAKVGWRIKYRFDRRSHCAEHRWIPNRSVHFVLARF